MNELLSIPKNTFSNLSKEKRDKILAALVSEFATKGYQKASLNNIVRKIGIAKGSLYQYFNNKEGLFLFVFDNFTQLVKKNVGGQDNAVNDQKNFWGAVSNVLWAGIKFIDQYPHYYQLYLNVLFEQDVPLREELIARVRLFSMEYFGPMVIECQSKGEIRSDVPSKTIVFLIDAALDRFLQGYARSYLDGGLALPKENNDMLAHEVSNMLTLLKSGIE